MRHLAAIRDRPGNQAPQEPVSPGGVAPRTGQPFVRRDGSGVAHLTGEHGKPVL